MTFDCVGTDPKGNMYMKFQTPFSVVEQCQLLQRSILVNSYAYYELDSNILEDHKYDSNCRQLEQLCMDYPEETKRSKYHKYFHDFFDADDSAHATSGFDLIERVRKDNSELYRHIAIDSNWALELKQKRGVA